MVNPRNRHSGVDSFKNITHLDRAEVNAGAKTDILYPTEIAYLPLLRQVRQQQEELVALKAEFEAMAADLKQSPVIINSTATRVGQEIGFGVDVLRDAITGLDLATYEGFIRSKLAEEKTEGANPNMLVDLPTKLQNIASGARKLVEQRGSQLGEEFVGRLENLAQASDRAVEPMFEVMDHAVEQSQDRGNKR